MEVGKYLLGFTPSGEPDLAREPDLKPLSEFRASLAHLKSLNPARLEQLMTGTLDLCSHRLDAWITSFATKRLAEMRKADPTGVLFGGYGWVMNLKPAAAQTKVAPPPGEQDPVFQSANNPGFIHTPSLTQAATAAVLRSGHLAHAGESKAERSAGHRSVVGACAFGDVAARRRTARAAARRAARLPVRAPLAGSRKGAIHPVLPRARAAGGAEAGVDCSTRTAGRSHRRQQRRGRPRAAAAVAGATDVRARVRLPAARRDALFGSLANKTAAGRSGQARRPCWKPS